MSGGYGEKKSGYAGYNAGGSSNGRSGGRSSRNGHGNSYSRNGYSSARQNGGNDEPKYVGAPYNFVPVPNRVLKVDDARMTDRAAFKEELLSGEIDYKVTAQSKVYIGAGKDKDFTRDEYGRYVIPGSSMRGLVRANAQILGMSDVGDDIDDYELMYRVVGSSRSRLKKKYDDILGADSKPIQVSTGKKCTISVLMKVKAGYIVKKSGGYVIYPVKGGPISPEKGEMNYYVLSEREVQQRLSDYPFFKNHPDYAMHDLSKPFVKRGRNYEGTENKNYKPGYHKVSYAVNGNGKVTGLDEPGKLKKTGFLMSTGKMHNKKVHYIIPEIDRDEDKAVPVSEKDRRAFSIDFENKKNTLGDNKAFFNLPENGQPKPVFYIKPGDDRLYFGFTPRLRLFYAHNVKYGLKQEPTGYDFVKSIFGMSKDNDSYRSKVSFSDAVLSNEPEDAAPVRVILAAPKPTSYWDYLVQNDDQDAVTYNDHFKLRGLKQYWLRDQIYMPDDAPKNKERVSSTLKPLPAGAEFKGKVRFQNLTEEELGLLLWAIYVDKDACLNIGMGKPFGYGVIKIDEIKVRKLDLATAYSCEDGLNLSPFSEVSVQDAIAGYKKYVNAKYGLDIDQAPGVKAFILMKTRRPAAEDIRYMSVSSQKKEYQNRQKPLPKIEDILKIGKTGNAKKPSEHNRQDSDRMEDVKKLPEQKKSFVQQERESGGESGEKVKNSSQEPKRASEKPEEGRVYSAVVSKTEGAVVRFSARINDGTCNGKIKFPNAEKKTLKDRYKKGTEIKVRCTSVDGDTAIWELVRE